MQETTSQVGSPQEPYTARLLAAARVLSRAVNRLEFGPPVAYVYNPLVYAWSGHEQYLLRFGKGPKRVLFLGMNPGPFGMTQTGVPFGEVSAVRQWLGIQTKVGSPRPVHPKRPVQGFDCPRSEVSGRRLWGFFQTRFQHPENFFREHLVVNYCPLVFLEQSGRNLTPDKLPPTQRAELLRACDAHLTEVVETLNPEWLVGVGAFAVQRAREALMNKPEIKIGQILHPSPANPAANRDWAGVVLGQIRAMGIWR